MAKKKERFERNRNLENQLLKIGIFVIFTVIVVVAAYFIFDAVLKKNKPSEERAFDAETYVHVSADDFLLIFGSEADYPSIESDELREIMLNNDLERYFYFYDNDNVSESHLNVIKKFNDTTKVPLLFVDLSSSEYAGMLEEDLIFNELGLIAETGRGLLIYKEYDSEEDQIEVKTHPTHIKNLLDLLVQAEEQNTETE